MIVNGVWYGQTLDETVDKERHVVDTCPVKLQAGWWWWWCGDGDDVDNDDDVVIGRTRL